MGGSLFMPSTEDYDWLGSGSYFWESDVVRAYQWAIEPRRKFSHPSVVGAAIELGNCLDLTTQSGIAAVKVAYEGFKSLNQKTGTPLPRNIDPAKDPTGDKILRRLDCAVMNYLFEIQKIAQESDSNSQSFSTVRALFPEGDELYPDAGFWEKHTFRYVFVNHNRSSVYFGYRNGSELSLDCPICIDADNAA
jgi:hypothetical protein